jgi:hypothetical protein
VWIHGDSAWLCLHCLQGLDAVMTNFQHTNIGPTWSNMVGHLDPANLDSVAIENSYSVALSPDCTKLCRWRTWSQTCNGIVLWDHC